MVDWIRNNLQTKVGVAIASLLLIVSPLIFSYVMDGCSGTNGIGSDEELIGIGETDTQWFVYGNNNEFLGYRTKEDPSKIGEGENAQGQNTEMGEGDRIQIRSFGYEIFPSDATESTSTLGITSMHTFRKRSGENILMRAYGTVLEWYDESQNTWEELNDGYATSSDFGFADYNINTDLSSFTYFGNASEPFSRWSGAHTNLNGALAGAEATITVDDTTDGFTTTGTLYLCGTAVTYTGKTATTFTGASGTPACADNRGVTQAVEEFASNPRGNLYLTSNNRLFISGTTSTPQAVFFSQYGDATDFITTSLVTDTTAEDSGIFNLGEGGGAVVAMAEDEGSIYFFKRSIIRRATLTDDLYTLSTLKPFDGKSQTIGAINQKTVFTGGNGIFFVTPDRQIMNITRVENVDYPQLVPISEPIKPTIDAADWDDSTGIFFKDKAYFATKSTSDSSKNDVVFVYNFSRKGWESPYIGFNIGDWAIYSGDDNEDQLYFGEVGSPNVYKTTVIPLDKDLGVTANWRSKEYTFGLPHKQKEIQSLFIEGYIAPNADVTVSLLLDNGGFTQTYQTEISGTEDDFIFTSPSYNVFGFTAYGTERFGSNDDFTGKQPFRLYLNKDFRMVPFYNAQIEFASDGENEQWEILRYGFEVREHSQPYSRGLFRAFR